MNIETLPTSIAVGKLPAEAGVKASRMLATANAVTVVDTASLEMAAIDMRNIRGHRDKLETERTAVVGPLNAAVKRINEWFRGPIAECDQAMEIIRGRMVSFQQEEQRKADEARREAAVAAEKVRKEAERQAAEVRAKAEAEARRQAEEEKRQQEAADRAAREAREAREREAKARADGDAAAARKARDEALAAEKQRREAEEAERKAKDRAEAAMEKGDQKAQEALQSADLALAHAPTPEPAKVAGLASTATWQAELTDLRALCAAIGAGTAPATLVEFSAKQGNQYARATKGEMPVPGVRFVRKAGVQVRG